MQNFQLSLFYNYYTFVMSSNFYRKYYAIFSVLDLTDFPDKNTEVGRTGYSRYAILCALGVKASEIVSNSAAPLKKTKKYTIKTSEACP